MGGIVKAIALCVLAFTLTAHGQLPDGVYSVTFQGAGPFQGMGTLHFY